MNASTGPAPAILRLFAASLLALACACAQAQPFGFVVNSDGVDLNMPPDMLYRINLATGEATSIGATGFQDIEAMAFDENGQLYGVDDASNSLLRIDAFSGAGIRVGGIENNLGLNATTSFDFGMTFVCGSAQPLLTSDTTSQLFQLDLANNGRAQEVGSFGEVSLTGLASAVIDGEFRIYGIGAGNINQGLYRIDPESLQATLVGPLAAAASYNDAGLAFDANGGLWAITDRTAVNGQSSGGQILNIDPETGAASVAGETFTGIESLAITALDCSGISDGDGDGDPGDPDGDPMPTAQEVPALSVPALLLMLAIMLMLAGRRLKHCNESTITKS